MASPNANPAYAGFPNVSSVRVSAVLTSGDGTGTIATNIYQIWKAGAASGSNAIGGRPSRVTIAVVSTNTSSNASAATVLRFFRSSKSGTQATTGGTDTFQIKELPVAALTTNQAAAAIQQYEFVFDEWFNNGDTLLVSTGTAAAANTAWDVTAHGVDY